MGLLQSHIDSNFVFSTENFESIVERLVILEKIHAVLKRAKYVVMSTESDIATALQTLNSFMDELGLFLDRPKRAYSSPADVMSGVFQMIRLFGTFPGPVFGCIIADRCNYIQCHVLLVSFSESFSIVTQK